MRVKVRVKVPNVERRSLKMTKDIRAEESNPRARLSPLTLNRALSTRQRTVFSWLPTFDKTLPEVLVWYRLNTTRLHPVYVPEYHKVETTAGYLRRFSRKVCIFATDADLRAIHLQDRPAFDMMSGLERKMNFTMRQGAGLVQIVEVHSSTRPEDAQQ
jgi:hypothetical protein